MLIPDAVHVWREADDDYHIEWATSAPDTQVDVQAVGASVAPDYSPEGSRARLRGLAPGQRHEFVLSDQFGTSLRVGERRLPLVGSPNFRDYGGYTTGDGRTVKWGYLYRSGQLSNLEDVDIDAVASLNLDLVCDFRRVEEQQNDPSRLPAHNPPRIASLPIIPGSNARFFEEMNDLSGPQPMFDFMCEINRAFATEQAPIYADMFREVLAVDDARFLVHCAAGKDRTGFAVAMVLLALGVSRDVVMQDYMLTRRFFLPEREMERLRRKYDMGTVDAQAILPMLEVHEAYLGMALETIDAEYGSIDDYLEQALGLGPAEREELRRRYLS